MKILEHTTQLVSAAGMFSKNENIEEIPTADIKYMLLPFMLGSLALKLTNNGNRLDVVKTAEVYFRDYLQRYVCLFHIQGRIHSCFDIIGVEIMGYRTLHCHLRTQIPKKQLPRQQWTFLSWLVDAQKKLKVTRNKS